MSEAYRYLSIRTLIRAKERPPADPNATTARKRAFDHGEPPRPGYSSPPARRIGWERDDG